MSYYDIVDYDLKLQNREFCGVGLLEIEDFEFINGEMCYRILCMYCFEYVVNYFVCLMFFFINVWSLKLIQNIFWII